MDRALHGDKLAANIVVIAACNPARAFVSSGMSHARERDLGSSWASGHYQVTALPASMDQLKWKFGALTSSQEREFISRRLAMMGQEKVPVALRMSLTAIIAAAQESIRTLAAKHIKAQLRVGDTKDDEDAEHRASSVVSLRDIQRVFSLFEYFGDNFHLVSSSATATAIKRKRMSLLLAVAVVYYMRLDVLSRVEFLDTLSNLPGERQHQNESLETVLNNAMNFVISQTMAPRGIAITRGLTENLFMALVCSLSRTPLMIVGPPGSSKVRC